MMLTMFSNMGLKPNQKQFDESLFKAYIEKFSDEDDSSLYELPFAHTQSDCCQKTYVIIKVYRDGCVYCLGHKIFTSVKRKHLFYLTELPVDQLILLADLISEL